MARMRIVKPGFFTNEEIAELPPLTRILFIGLWTLADRKGRLEDRPKRIKAEIMPYDNHNIDSALSTLHDTKFIVRYSHEGKKYIQISNFEKHQHCHVKESESTIPAPCLHGASTPLTVTGTVTEQEQEHTMSGKPGQGIPFDAIVSDFNSKAGTAYKHTSRKTQDLIRARWNEGFREPDFFKVHDHQCSKWLADSKMKEYLRPETIYGTKFEGYLNNPPMNGGTVDGKIQSRYETPGERRERELRERHKRITGVSVPERNEP